MNNPKIKALKNTIERNSDSGKLVPNSCSKILSPESDIPVKKKIRINNEALVLVDTFLKLSRGTSNNKATKLKRTPLILITDNSSEYTNRLTPTGIARDRRIEAILTPIPFASILLL